MLRHITWLLTIALIGSQVACGEDLESSQGEQLGQQTSTLWSVATNAVPTTRTWDSGNDNNLSTNGASSWHAADCINTTSNGLVTQLRAWRERSSSADNFIARLSVACREYYSVGTNIHADATDRDLINAYSADNYRSGVRTSGLSSFSGQVPTGVRLVINPNSYVKDVRLRWKVLNGSTTDFSSVNATTTGGSATGYGGSTHDLNCPAGKALRGVGVRYSTNNGKIRRFQIYCVNLNWI